MNGSTFVYVTYIRCAPERLWSALTDTNFIPRFWMGVKAECDFHAGSAWRLILDDGRVADVGEILVSDPPQKLVIKWKNQFRPELEAEGYSRCTFTISAHGEATKLTVLHEIETPQSKLIEAVSGGWPMVLSNLKSLLETGEVAVTSRG